MNHAEPELLSQAFDEIKVRIREANGRRLEFFVLHESQIHAWAIGLSLPKSKEERQETAGRCLTDNAPRRISVNIASQSGCGCRTYQTVERAYLPHPQNGR